MRLSLVCLLFLISFCGQSQSTQMRFDDLDTMLTKILSLQKVAGFAVAVVKGDSVIYSKGFGYRDYENKKPVTPNTLFAIGSSTKAFTCTAIGQLEKEGKLKLNDKATSVLPRLKFYNNDLNSHVTLRDMMSHRTGIERYDYSWYLFNTSNRDSLLSRIQYFEPTAELRQTWLYNNFMYLALGVIIEDKTHKSWEQNIKDRFFTPLGMKRSMFTIAEMEKDTNSSKPYLVDDKGTIKKMNYYNINGMGPAGSINSSANEMANWLKMWIAGGKYKGKEILPTGYVAEAASSQAIIHGALPGKFNDIYFANYGLGWMLGSYRGFYQVEHGGNIDGFSASVCFYPSEQIGIVVLTNQNASTATATVRNIISDKVLNLSFRDWNKEYAKKFDSTKKEEVNGKKNPVKGTKPSHALQDYAGLYNNPAYGSISIQYKKDTLFTKLGNQNIWLKHYHYDVFVPRELGKNAADSTNDGKGVVFSFSTDYAGKISSIIIPTKAPERDEVFLRINPAKPITTAELEKYTGEYSLGPQTVTVSNKNGIIYILVPGQPEYETEYIGDHTFNLKALKGFSAKFTIASEHKASEISFIQPNGTFTGKRKK